MKLLVIFLCLACAVLASLEEDRQQWVNFKIEHGKFYKNKQEENLRFSTFQQNLREIEEHNREYLTGKRTYRKGVNKFADFTKEEINSMLGHRSGSRLNEKVYKKPVDADIPETLDWRDSGAVTNVKDQGDCGSCWAFSALGTIEGFNFLKNNILVSLSAQQLVDCSEENGGCAGGDEAPALKYVKEFGVQTESDYPYEDRDEQPCRYNKSAIFLKIKDYVQIERGNEDDLLTAVATLGPISVALDATELVFYRGGVFTSTTCETDSTNHAVLAVGYGNDEETGFDYWLVKNSWGADWGESGYFKIRRGTNECAIAIDCVYPVI